MRRFVFVDYPNTGSLWSTSHSTRPQQPYAAHSSGKFSKHKILPMLSPPVFNSCKRIEGGIIETREQKQPANRVGQIYGSKNTGLETTEAIPQDPVASLG